MVPSVEVIVPVIVPPASGRTLASKSDSTIFLFVPVAAIVVSDISTISSKSPDAADVNAV
jgi:hypothetical protein